MSAFLFAALLAAPGAAPAAPATVPPTAPPIQAEQPPLSVWRPADASMEHLQSGLRCPETLGAFRRDQVTAFNPFGIDVGCGYTSARSTITVYLTRAPNVDEAFAQAKTSVMQAQASRNPRLVSERRETTDGLDWRRADFALDGVVRSDVWLTDLQGWQFKFRTTYPTADATAVDEALPTATLAAQASAGRHLALCAKSVAPGRPGKLLKLKKGDPLIVASLLGAAASSKPPKASPPTFCLEDGLAVGGKGFLLWRGVTPEGVDAQVDRLTAMTMGPPPTLEVSLDGVGNLVAGELAGGKAPSRWLAALSSGGTTSIYGYFDGRPSAKAGAALLGSILDGKAVTLGDLSADGKTINLNPPSR